MTVATVTVFSMFYYQRSRDFTNICLRDVFYQFKVLWCFSHCLQVCTRAKSAEYWDVRIEVDSTNMPVEMVRNSSLKAIDEPIRDAIILVGKVCDNMHKIRVLHR